MNITVDGEWGEAETESETLNTPDPAVLECRATAGFPSLSGQ